MGGVTARPFRLKDLVEVDFGSLSFFGEVYGELPGDSFSVKVTSLKGTQNPGWLRVGTYIAVRSIRMKHAQQTNVWKD